MFLVKDKRFFCPYTRVCPMFMNILHRILVKYSIDLLSHGPA